MSENSYKLQDDSYESDSSKMVEIKNATKRFGGEVGVAELSCDIPRGSIFGLVGANGAGKSTLMRMIAGVYRADEGEVLVEGKPVFDNPEAKENIAFVPDELYFVPGATLARMSRMYESTRKNFDKEMLFDLADKLNLSLNKPVSQFSKGMRRQAATILALSCKPDIILFDETFDGLDPIVRGVVKRLVCDSILERQATAVITSHSLRELEDTCDQLALLHQGGLVLQSEVSDLKTSLFKVQIAFARPFTRADIESVGVEIHAYSQQGSVANIIAGGDRAEAAQKLNVLGPAILEILPLTLEEVFNYEMKARGYDFDKVFGEGESDK